MDSDNISIHSAAESSDLEAAELLLRENIDIYTKDKKGMTPFHILMQKRIDMFNSSHRDHMEQSFINDSKKNENFIAKLLKHASTNLNNTKDVSLLNFHAACMLDNCEIAESFLGKIADVNQPISENSSIWPGYTGLHFAAHCSIKTTKMLIEKEGNLLSCDATGVTPLDICIKSFTVQQVHSILMSVPMWKDILFLDGKTKLLDCIAVLQNIHIVSYIQFLQNIDNVQISLPKNSPLWPGYTILHIAVTMLPDFEYEIHEILKCDADVTKQDCHGSTPIHLAFRQGKPRILSKLFQSHTKVINPVDKDNLSHLHIACAGNDINPVRKLLTIEANMNIAYTGKSLTKIKHGWTPLHVACFNGHLTMTKMLLEAGANLLQTDVEGSTIIHWIFGSDEANSKILDLLTASEQFKDCTVEDTGLTHFHVMVSWNKTKVVERLLDSGANIEAVIHAIKNEKLKQFVGCRPLHLAMMYDHVDTIKILLQRGADILAKKLDGSFPLLAALTGVYDESFQQLFLSLLSTNEELQKRMERETGLTMLHVMCRVLDVEKIKNLLDQNVDVDARIYEDSPIWPGYTPLHVLASTESTLSRGAGAQTKFNASLKLLLDRKADVASKSFNGDTPLHLALKSRSARMPVSLSIGHQRQTIKVLLQRGADILAKKTDGFFPLLDVLTGKCGESLVAFFVSLLWMNEVMQKRMEREMGLTMLHVACRSLDVEKIRILLRRKIDVNKKIREDCLLWPGFTPLHVLVSTGLNLAGTQKQLEESQKLLLNQNAYVTLTNADGDTPVHLALKSRSVDQARIQASFLLEHQRHFHINPINNKGLSHFSVACLVCNLTAVKKFLQCGIDVNQPVSELSDEFAGKSPLHMALSASFKSLFNAKLQVQVLDFLLQHGAKLHAVANNGRINGQTSFEMLLHQCPTIEGIKLFMEYGCRVNSYNRINNKGYMAMIIANAKYKDFSNGVLEFMIGLPDIAEIDERGRHAIYNILCSEQIYLSQNELTALIEKLIESGCDIHQRDRRGKTPLHVAVEMSDEKAVRALLRCGADVNLVDFAGKSPFSYCFEPTISILTTYKEAALSIQTALATHLRVLERVGLEVSTLNIDLMFRAQVIRMDETSLDDELERTRNMKIGKRGLTLYDFVFENDVTKIISTFTSEERDMVGTVLEWINCDTFDTLRDLLKLQYRKVLQRFSLIRLATVSLHTLLGFPLPILCVDIVFKLLTNVELQCIVSASIENDDLEMDTDE